MKPRYVALLTGLAIGVFPLSAVADGVNVQTFNQATGLVYETTESAFTDRGPLGTLVPDRRYTIGINYHFADNPLVEYQRNSETRTGVLVDGIHTLQLSGGYRYGDWTVSAILQLHESHLSSGTYNFAFGDMRLQTKYQAWKSLDGRTGVVVIGDVLVPTGNPELFVSNGGLGLGVRGALEHNFGFLSAAANAGVMLFTRGTFRDIDYRRQLPYSFALEVPVLKRVAVNAEFFQTLSFPVSSAQNPGEIYLGAKILLPRDYVGSAGMSFGGTDFLRSNELRVHIGLKTVLGTP